MKYLVTVETREADIVPSIFTIQGVTKVAAIPAQELLRMEPDDRLEFLDRILGLSSES